MTRRIYPPPPLAPFRAQPSRPQSSSNLAAQAKTRGTPPPPTRFGGGPKAAVQAKAAIGVAPPPIRYRPSAAQAMMGCSDPYCLVLGCLGGHPPLLPVTYSQSTDPSVTPFLKSGEEVMGESAVTRQLAGKTPSASEVRVKAYPSSDTRAGSGAHEFYPTDRRGDPAKNKELIPLQSGARSRTDRTFFRDTSGDVGGHTGAFPKPAGRGSTHTSGQKEAHDRLRDFVPAGSTPVERNIERLSHQIEGLARGQDILTSDSITGAIPNLKGATPLESPTAAKKRQREAMAKEVHVRREKAKQRVNTLARSKGIDPPSSPPRAAPGEVGDGAYTYDVQGPPSPFPSFTQTDSVKEESDWYAWSTASLRIDAEYQTSKECKGCRMLNSKFASNCSTCGALL